jgi:hypothetical protein
MSLGAIAEGNQLQWRIYMIRNVLSLMIACAAGACAVTPPASQPVQDDVGVSSIETASPPTAAMLAASQTGDPRAMADSVNLLSCPAAHGCDEQAFDCLPDWSASQLCDTQCTTQHCAEGNIEKDFASQFRTCFGPTYPTNPNDVCTEVRIVTFNSCGC